MNVTWRVDDLKISHKENDEVKKFIRELEEVYGEKLTVHRGKVHPYLGMHFDYSTSGIFTILNTMVCHVYCICGVCRYHIVQSAQQIHSVCRRLNSYPAKWSVGI